MNPITMRNKKVIYDSPVPQPMWHQGRCIGMLMPKAKPENLGLGIQTWSLPKGRREDRA